MDQEELGGRSGREQSSEQQEMEDREDRDEESSEYESEYETEEDEAVETIKMTHDEYDAYITDINTGYNDLKTSLTNHRVRVAREGEIVSVVESLEKVNSLYEDSKKIPDSHYQNEITNLDSQLIKEIGEQLSIGVNSISLGVSSKKLDIEEFKVKFARFAKKRDSDFDTFEELLYHGSTLDVDSVDRFHDSFDWSKMGNLYMKFSKKAPTIDFMLGPLDLEFKKRQVVRAGADYLKSGQLVRPDQVQMDDVVNNQELDTYQSAIHCFEILREKNDDVPINLFKFFINPRSFSQSIENLFYTSFLINHNKLLLFKDKFGTPFLRIVDSNSKLPDYIASVKDRENKSHLIFKLEYDTWEKLIAKYEIKTLFLGNRT